jgi:hypothetical protein
MAAMIIMNVVAPVLGVGSLGVLAWFFISTAVALKKFTRLDARVRDKLLVLEYFMAAVRNLSREDLIRLSELPDAELRRFNMIHDYGERIRAMRKKIRGEIGNPSWGPRNSPEKTGEQPA